MTTSRIERAWLERIEQSALVGFFILEDDGKIVQRVENDPDLREALVEYQRERIRQLTLSEASVSKDDTESEPSIAQRLAPERYAQLKDRLTKQDSD